jgi:hypothetical protein
MLELKKAIIDHYSGGKYNDLCELVCKLLIDNGLQIEDINPLLERIINKPDGSKLKGYLFDKRKDTRCVMCGVGHDIRAHHIKPRGEYPELEFDEDNIAFLCDTCHKLIHASDWGASKIDPVLKKKAVMFFKQILKDKLASQ